MLESFTTSVYVYECASEDSLYFLLQSRYATQVGMGGMSHKFPTMGRPRGPGGGRWAFLRRRRRKMNRTAREQKACTTKEGMVGTDNVRIVHHPSLTGKCVSRNYQIAVFVPGEWVRQWWRAAYLPSVCQSDAGKVGKGWRWAMGAFSKWGWNRIPFETAWTKGEWELSGPPTSKCLKA